MRPSHWLALIVALASAAWLATGTIGGRAPAPPAPEAAAAPEPPPRPVRVASIAAEPHTAMLRVLGLTEASRRVEVRAQIDGRIAELPLDKGAAVQAGTVLARLDIEDRAAKLAEARALGEQRRRELAAWRQLAERGTRGALSVAEGEAQLAAAEAMLARAEVDLAHTTVLAPFAGVIEARPAELGARLRAGDPVAAIVTLDPLRIVAHLPEAAGARIAAASAAAGTAAPLLAEARLPDGRRLSGRLSFVSPAADPTTRTFRVEMEAPNPAGIPAGLTAEFSLALGTVPAHRISPALLVLADDGRIGLRAVSAENRVVFLPVRILGNGEDDRLWVEGLPQRLTIITVGQDYVREGQRVAPVPDQAAAPLAPPGTEARR